MMFEERLVNYSKFDLVLCLEARLTVMVGGETMGSIIDDVIWPVTLNMVDKDGD